jgi:GTP-binding protein EngB required for normal cell division
MKETWQDLASSYLRGRPTLKRVCLLIDSRHGVKDSDHETMKNLDRAAVSYQLILTKVDQLKAAESARWHQPKPPRASWCRHPRPCRPAARRALALPS